jgi:hypothetical protein
VTRNPGVEAVRKLAHMGYRFTVNGETIKARYEAPGEPDPARVRPLLSLVKANKPEVLNFLNQKPEAPQTIEKCSCGSPAWDTDAEGKPKCWCCLAIPGLFGKH